MRIIERTEGHYEVQEVELGKVYTWRSDSVLIECDCGARPELTRLATTCGECDEDYAIAIEEELAARQRRMEEEDLRPWRHDGEGEDIGIPF